MTQEVRPGAAAGLASPPAPGELASLVAGPLVHRGKVKAVYAVQGRPDLLLIDFTDDATAFDGKKRATIAGKGEACAAISARFFDALQRHQVPTHFIGLAGPARMVVWAVRIIPLEVVVRNRVAGSMARRLGLEEGTALGRPVVEFYYKSDPLGDPWVLAEHAEALGWATAEELAQMRRLALAANEAMRELASAAGLELVDFKLEFGRRPADGALLVADEISPDTCRFWEVQSGERMDKDRFRRDLGKVEEAYQEVRRRIEEAAGRWRATSRSST